MQGGDEAEQGEERANAEHEGNDELIFTDKEGHSTVVDIALDLFYALVGDAKAGYLAEENEDVKKGNDRRECDEQKRKIDGLFHKNLLSR